TKGDFFLSELTLAAGTKPVPFRGASHDFATPGKYGAQFCFDGDAQTGWTIGPATARPHEAVFNFTQPIDLEGNTTIRMVFERYYASGLGRFRISLTTAGKHA